VTRERCQGCGAVAKPKGGRRSKQALRLRSCCCCSSLATKAYNSTYNTNTPCMCCKAQTHVHARTQAHCTPPQISWSGRGMQLQTEPPQSQRPKMQDCQYLWGRWCVHSQSAALWQMGQNTGLVCLRQTTHTEIHKYTWANQVGVREQCKWLVANSSRFSLPTPTGHTVRRKRRREEAACKTRTRQRICAHTTNTCAERPARANALFAVSESRPGFTEGRAGHYGMRQAWCRTQGQNGLSPAALQHC
jgi:hypothetical protein